MNVYNYIANSNPDAAYEICKKYGYSEIGSVEELANCLQFIVANEGEPALKEVMALHPERGVILELFEKKSEPVMMDDYMPIMQQERLRLRDCSCMMNADGDSKSGQGIASQTNLIILVAAMIVSISIISMKK